jgi:hypothetical protein
VKCRVFHGTTLSRSTGHEFLVSQLGIVPFCFQAAGDQPVVGVDGAVVALGFAGVVAGLFDLASPLGQRGVVAVLELLGGGQAGLQRGGSQRGQKRLRDSGVDGDTADAQVPGAAPFDQLTGAVQ